MRVLFVTSEAYPLAKSGGLADVSAALPIALKRGGIDVRILLPGYPGAGARLKNPCIEARLEPLLGVTDAALISGELPDSDVPVLLVHAPSLFARDGGLYQDRHGHDWPDNALRFAFLAHVAARVARGCLEDWAPDVLHANDWHAGLAPLLLATQDGPRPATVFTIHNLAFQGNFPPDLIHHLGVPSSVFHADGVEFYGQLSFLKAAIRYSDKITTVSPTYAREVLTPEFGCGFDGVLQNRQRDFSGILNGIDETVWNPLFDLNLPRPYGARDIAGKRVCKAELQHQLGLEVNAEIPLIGFVSRLTHQKMADVVIDAVPAIVASGAQLTLLGTGDPGFESALEELARRFPEQVAVEIGYDEPAAHRLQGGADILLAPARYEPCGLTQLYALRYGTVPVVRRTGGLADTVADVTSPALTDHQATGFVFDEASVDGLMSGVDRALAHYREPLTWRRLQLQGMSQDFSWGASAAQYMALYSEASGLPTPAPEEDPPAEEDRFSMEGAMIAAVTR